jgi:hypothetical protein
VTDDQAKDQYIWKMRPKTKPPRIWIMPAPFRSKINGTLMNFAVYNKKFGFGSDHSIYTPNADGKTKLDNKQDIFLNCINQK